MPALSRTLGAVAYLGLALPAFAANHGNPDVGGARMFAEKTIVENAVNSADHTTLVAAVQAAGLVDALNGAGPLTVFAPTNSAFDALPAGTVETLLMPGNKERLAKVLTCHVAPAKAVSTSIAQMMDAGGGTAEIDTLGGCKITASMSGNAIVLTDEQGRKANVTTADVMQSNGVIHVVDGVLLPARENAAAETPTAQAGGDGGPMENGNPMVGGAPMFASKTIVENALNSADHTTLVAAVQAAGLVDTLNGSGPFTVFAPTNAAFDALPAGTVDSLLAPAGKAKLVKVLTAHVVSGTVTAADIRARVGKDGFYNMQTVSGDALSAKVMPSGAIWIFDEKGEAYKVSTADVMQSNGVIHVVDGVLLPR